MSRRDWCQWFPVSPQAAYDFFSDVGNLNRLSPPFVDFELLSPAYTELTPGMLFDYRLKLHGIGVNWRTRIEEVEPGRRFTDSQLTGPYRSFLHTHEFYPVDGGTLMVDRLDFEVGYGPFGPLARTLVVEPMLEAIFRHRGRVAAELLGGGSNPQALRPPG